MPLIVATRIHGTSILTDDPALSKLTTFLRSASRFSQHVIIATEFVLADPSLFNAVSLCAHEFQRKQLTQRRQHKSRAHTPSDTKCCSSASDSDDSDSDNDLSCSMVQIHVLPILEWTGFVAPLNAAARKAAQISSSCPHDEAPLLLFQSLEVLPTPSAICKLRQCMSDNMLVCGAALDGHDFHKGLIHLSGTTCPWNTLALWSLPRLLRTGFLPVSDGHFPNAPNGGVEEVACVAVQQKLFPTTSGCTLIELNENEIVWKTTFVGQERKEWHAKKMQSKMIRAAQQLKALELEHSTSMVCHVDGRTRGNARTLVGRTEKKTPMTTPPKYINGAIRTKELRMAVHNSTTVLPTPFPASAAPAAPAASADSSFAYVQPHLSFSNETVLLTGGAGFIGSHTAQRLLERGNKVIVIDNFNDYYDVKQKEANIDHLHRVVQQRQRQCIATVDDDDDEYPLVVVRGSICDRQVLAELFDTHQPTLVIHLAARAGVRPSLEDPQLYVDTNVMGTTNLLEISRVNHVKHFVYASSSSVYGGSMKSEFSETDVVDHPVSPYAATKKATELLASTYHHLYQLNTSGLRFFTVYGPRGRPDMAPYKFLKRASQGTPIDQYGDGTSERDYTYVDDIVDGILRTMDRPSGCQVYNLGNGVPITLKKFISLVKEVASDKHELKINYMPNQPGDVNRTCANITKATTMLGYQPKTSFENGLRRTFEWFQTKK